MSTKFTVPAKAKRNKFQDEVSKNDALTYEIDFTAWQEDNSTITAVTWTVEGGSVGVSGEALTDGVASALLTFTDEGKCLVSVKATTAVEVKQIWLEIKARDYELIMTDYNYYT